MPAPDLPAPAMRRFWDAFNGRDLRSLNELVDAAYVNHEAAPGTPNGPTGQAQLMQRLWDAMPDARFAIELLAVTGETVVCVGTMSGTHRGELLGVAASGRQLSWRQCHLVTVRDGRAIAHRAIRDDLGLLQQMGGL